MAIHQPVNQQSAQSTEQEISLLWGKLSPQHQQIVLKIVQAFAKLDGEADEKNRGSLSLMMLARELEYEAMTDEERVQAEEEWEDFKDSMNANRAPEPPLFP